MSTFNVVLKDREISFDSGEDLKEYDLKSLLQIDYTDIKTEIAYFPFILNQINFLFIKIIYNTSITSHFSIIFVVLSSSNTLIS